MKIIKLMGGLGNQMQQYALYEKFISLGEETYLDTSWFADMEMQQKALAPRKLELDYFPNVTYKTPSKEQIKSLIGDESITSKVKRKLFPKTNKHFQESSMWHPEIFTDAWKDAYLEGYWASEKYYADILPTLRERFQYPEPNEANRQVANQIHKSAYSVSMHIRRGDYLDSENLAMFGNICTEAYYESAIKQIKKDHPDAEFYIFSDDQSYVREHYTTKEYHAIDINHGADSYYDIWLMSQCDANICANSTFSFWGARLNFLPTKEELNNKMLTTRTGLSTQNIEGTESNTVPYKTMIRPSIHKNTQVYDADLMHDLWNGWTLINANGNIV